MEFGTEQPRYESVHLYYECASRDTRLRNNTIPMIETTSLKIVVM